MPTRAKRGLSDELALVATLGDIIDGLESFQAEHADAFIEDALADLRFVRDSLRG